MNLVVFCHYLGDIPLQDVDMGTYVLEVINDGLTDGDEEFAYEMSGKQMFMHYKTLTPASRLVLDELELLSKDDWRVMVSQCETLRVRYDLENSKREFYIQAVYLVAVAGCMLIATFGIVSYIANALYHSDKVDSYLVQWLITLIEQYTSSKEI